MSVQASRWTWPEQYSNVLALDRSEREQLFWNVYSMACDCAPFGDGDSLSLFRTLVKYPKVNPATLEAVSTGSPRWSSDLLFLLLWWLVADRDVTVLQVYKRQFSEEWFPLFLPMRTVPLSSLQLYWKDLRRERERQPNWKGAITAIARTVPSNAGRFPCYWEFAIDEVVNGHWLGTFMDVHLHSDTLLLWVCSIYTCMDKCIIYQAIYHDLLIAVICLSRSNSYCWTHCL